MNVRKLFRSILPGIFIFGFNIGTGSVTAMAKAGATFGMSLLWTIAISCAVTYFMITIYGKYTLVTNETALWAFRKHLHPLLGVFFIVALTAHVCGSIMGVMGIVAEVCSSLSEVWIQGGIPAIYFAIFFVGLVYVIFLNGRTGFFQHAMAVIVGIMAISFIINFFIMMPPLLDIAKGMIPRVPDASLNQSDSPFLVIASMVGTTVFSGLFIIRTTLVKEAGWTMTDRRIQRRDAMLSAVMMFGASAAVMAAAAGTLHKAGLGLRHAAQMVQLLEPFAGRVGVTIFVFGIIAAGVSSQFPNVMLLPWLLCDYSGRSCDMTLPRYRIIVGVLSLLGLVVPIFNARPVVVMIVSQAFGSLLLPVTVLSMLILGNKRAVMGDHKHSAIENMILLSIFAFSLIMSFCGLRGLWPMLSRLFS